MHRQILRSHCPLTPQLQRYIIFHNDHILKHFIASGNAASEIYYSVVPSWQILDHRMRAYVYIDNKSSKVTIVQNEFCQN